MKNLPPAIWLMLEKTVRGARENMSAFSKKLKNNRFPSDTRKATLY